jgi:hypothetical protein
MPAFFREQIHTTLLMTLGAVGLSIGIVLYDIDSTPLSERFSGTPAFVVWVFLMATQAGVLAVVFLPLARALRVLEKHFARGKLEVGVAAAAFALLFSLPAAVPRTLYLSEGYWPLAHHSTKVMVFAVVAFLTSLLAVVGLLLVRSATSSLFTDKDETDRDLVQYLGLRDYAENFLLILGGMIGIATISLGALRKALLAVGYSGEAFPAVLVLAYGAYFTLLVALIYLPVFVALRETGLRLLNQIYPVLPVTSSTWTEQFTKRQALERALRLEATAEQSLRSGVAILAPLIGGGVSVLLG